MSQITIVRNIDFNAGDAVQHHCANLDEAVAFFKSSQYEAATFAPSQSQLYLKNRVGYHTVVQPNIECISMIKGEVNPQHQSGSGQTILIRNMDFNGADTVQHHSGSLDDAVAFFNSSGYPCATYAPSQAQLYLKNLAGFHTVTQGFECISMIRGESYHLPQPENEHQTYFALRSVSSGYYLDGRNPGMADPLMTNRNPEGDAYLQWSLDTVGGAYAIRSRSSGHLLDGRDHGTTQLLITNRNPVGDHYLQWQFERVENGYVAIKSVSSGGYLDGRGGQAEPLVTYRDPHNDTYLQWTVIPMIH